MIQSVLFDRDVWKKPIEARRWLYYKNIKPMKAVHKTKNLFRYRITDPDQYQNFYTKQHSEQGVSIVYGY